MLFLTVPLEDTDGPINPSHTQALHHTSRQDAAGEPRNPRAEVEGGAKADPPSLPREPKSTQAHFRFTLMSLTVSLEDADDPVNPDHTQVLHNRTGKNAAGENRLDQWKSTLSAAAKLLLRTVRDSADACPPLKSATGGICFILENYEVWFTTDTPLRGATMLTLILANEGKR